jgi:uncharacterized membrane protein YvlD (DUF360 family)
MTHAVKLIARALLIWVIEAVGLAIVLRFLPGVTINTWSSAFGAVLVIALLNALIRPVILLISAKLGIIVFGVAALFLNAFLILLADALLPGFSVDGLWTAFLLAIGLALVTAALSAMLCINDDDSFYRNVIRRLARRKVPTEGLDRPGTVVIQIDGLAEPLLRRAFAERRMPTLQAWLSSGSHRLSGWECQIPSMTTASQAGVLHGDYSDLPAFYWYQKEDRRLMASGSPGDLHDVERRISTGQGLLAGHGWTVMALFSGDAERAIMTTTKSINDDGKLTVDPSDFYAYLFDPYNLYRGIAGLVGAAVVECWQALRQHVEDVQPRTHRAGKFAIQRGVCNVVARDMTTWGVVLAMYRAQPVVFCNYLGYDEVGHYAGPETHDAMDTLPGIDRQIRQLVRAAREAPRNYQFVVYSDHGQTTAPLFEKVYGKPLQELVRELIQAESAVQISGARDEGLAHVSSFLNGLVQGQGLMAKGTRRLIGKQNDAGPVELAPTEKYGEQAAAAEVVVTSSGNLGHVYFAQVPERLTVEQIAVAYPGLVEALVGHPGVEFLIVVSETRGPIVIGKHGIRELDPDIVVEGDDPLAPFTPHTAGFLCRLARFPHSGDVMVMGKYDASTGQVITMDELVGAHGGVGGMQTEPFVMFPAGWTDRPPEIIGADGLHHFLLRYIRGETNGAAAHDVGQNGATVHDVEQNGAVAHDVERDGGRTHAVEQNGAVTRDEATASTTRVGPDTPT